MEPQLILLEIFFFGLLMVFSEKTSGRKGDERKVKDNMLFLGVFFIRLRRRFFSLEEYVRFSFGSIFVGTSLERR